jgi:hypothetical protein
MNFPAFAAALLLPFTAGPAAAQLRPLDPLEWRLIEARSPEPAVHLEVGAGLFHSQRAALAGVEGRLVEAGNFRAFWRTGRIVLEAGGTAQRFFRDEARFAPPHPAVNPAYGGNRHDTGDIRFATTVRLTGDAAPVTAAIRFGTRLPTTDNLVGLDRDATDFYALAGGAWRRGGLLLAGEAGVSINGTRETDFEQKDVLQYALLADWTRGPLQPRITVVGDVLGPSRQLRGSEPLGEVRVGARSGGRTWLQVDAVRGFRQFSPAWGVLLAAGRIW